VVGVGSEECCKGPLLRFFCRLGGSEDVPLGSLNINHHLRGGVILLLGRRMAMRQGGVQEKRAPMGKHTLYEKRLGRPRGGAVSPMLAPMAMRRIHSTNSTLLIPFHFGVQDLKVVSGWSIRMPAHTKRLRSALHVLVRNALIIPSYVTGLVQRR
jgi:hypothetical protein